MTPDPESTEAVSPIAGDLARECFCTCHIAPSKLSTNPEFGVYLRIECTHWSWLIDETGLLCRTCGRKGKERYAPIDDKLAREFDVSARRQRQGGTTNFRKVYEQMGKFERDLKDLFDRLDQQEKRDDELRKKAQENLDQVEKCLDVVRELLQLFLDDGHVGSDFMNWIRLARFFGREQDARELADSIDPQGKWLEAEV